MALGPQDVLALSQNDLLVVEQLERLIDEKLQTAYEPPGSYTTNLETLAAQVKCSKITFRMKKELLSRYSKSGWNIYLAPNDSNSLVFAGPALPTPEPDLIPNNESVDQMLDKMKKAKNNPPTGHKPPVIMPMTRADSPYKQKD